jgi:hypothetical protein
MKFGNRAEPRQGAEKRAVMRVIKSPKYLSPRVVLAIPLAIAAGLVASPRGVGGPAPEAALAAIRARQESVKTLMVEYKQTEVVAKGAKSEGAAPLMKPTTIVPPEETTLESVDRLLIDGEKVRCEDNHPSWLMPQGILQEQKRVSVANGSGAKVFFPTGLGPGATPTGVIQREPRSLDVKAFTPAPLTTTFRGLDPMISAFPAADMKPSGVTLLIDGALCEEHVIDYSDVILSSWLDTTKDYVPRRLRLQRQGRLLEQADVTYRRHETCGWSPTSWVCNYYSGHATILRSTSVQVLDFRVNEPQPAEQFDIRFPPGTTVRDGRTLKTNELSPMGTCGKYLVPGRCYPGSYHSRAILGTGGTGG